MEGWGWRLGGSDRRKLGGPEGGEARKAAAAPTPTLPPSLGLGVGTAAASTTEGAPGAWSCARCLNGIIFFILVGKYNPFWKHGNKCGRLVAT